MSKIAYKDVIVGMVLSVKLDGDNKNTNHTVTKVESWQPKNPLTKYKMFKIEFDNRPGDEYLGYDFKELDLV